MAHMTEFHCRICRKNHETEIVYVVRIMYGGRDVHKQLSQTEDVSED